MQRQEIAFLFFALLISGKLFAQAPSISWQRCLGGWQDDIGYSMIQAHGDSEAYIVAGESNSVDGDVSGCHCDIAQGINGPHDAWIVKFNKKGVVWQKCLGGNGDDGAYHIIPTSDGGYAACGWTRSTDGDFTGYHGDVDAWVAKLDANGKLIWAKCFGGSGNDVAFSIIEAHDESRDIIMLGYTNSTDGDVSGWHIDTSANKNPDVWIVRMSPEGKIRWQKCYGGSGVEPDKIQNVGEYEFSIIQTLDGGFVFCCGTNSNNGDVIGNHLDSAGHTTLDFWVVKLDGIGNIEWQKCLGGSFTDVAHSIIQVSDGGYIIAGQTGSNDGDVSGLHKPHDKFTSVTNEWVVKLNSSGSLQWQKCLGGDNVEKAFSIIRTSEGDYLTTGFAYSQDINAHGGEDVWVVRLSADRKYMQWQKCYGGTGNDRAYSIIKTSDGGYAFAGETQSNEYDVYGNHDPYRAYDIWFVKLNPDTVTESVTENYTIDAQSNVKVYPNPASSEIKLSMNANFSLSGISFYDVMGRQYFPPHILENNVVSCDVHDFPSGIYLARLGWVGDLTWESNYPGTFTLPFIVQH